jgi:hypothetical protein
VRHAKFGDGTVIESKLSGDDESDGGLPGIGIKRSPLPSPSWNWDKCTT